MLETTLNKIKEYGPCKEGWDELLAFLGKTKADDEPLSLLTILESNGIRDAIWALRAVEGMDGPIRLFACFCARYSLYIFEREHPDDDRLRRVIERVEKFARGQASQGALTDAEHVARRVVDVYSGDSSVLVKNIAWVTAPHAAMAAFGVYLAEEYRIEEFKRLCLLGSEYELEEKNEMA